MQHAERETPLYLQKLNELLEVEDFVFGQRGNDFGEDAKLGFVGDLIAEQEDLVGELVGLEFLKQLQ